MKLGIALVVLLLSACAVGKEAQVNSACKEINHAWETYSSKYKKELKRRQLTDVFHQKYLMSKLAEQYIPEASGALRAAGQKFRDLAANDSGFAVYAETAFEAASLSGDDWAEPGKFKNQISKLYFFCGSN